MLTRLHEFQNYLWSYETDLTGADREIEIDDLRPYVAYPTAEQARDTRFPRRHFAVRDVRLESSFPHLEAERLSLVDLPGLGETIAGAEEHHVLGLADEVDIVLYVKQPNQGMGFWMKEDDAALALLDRARGAVNRRRDFVFIASNESVGQAEAGEAMRDQIRTLLNGGIENQHYKVLRCDASNVDNVYENVLQPVLEHLATRLGQMDSEVLQDAVERSRSTSHLIEVAVGSLLADLRRHAPQQGVARERLAPLSKRLRGDLAVALDDLVRSLLREARVAEGDPSFEQAINDADKKIREWITNWFGQGRDEWVARSVKSIAVHKAPDVIATEQLNEARVFISEQFNELDLHFEAQIAELHSQVAGLLKARLGGLLQDLHGREALEALAELLEQASEPCPSMSRAVRNILKLELGYRSHFHPFVRAGLDSLDPSSPQENLGASADVGREELAERLYALLETRASQAAWEAQKALLRQENTMALARHAAAEQFEDSLIRSETSEVEFDRLSNSYRDEIWPGVFQGLHDENARVSRVRHHAREAVETVAELGR